LKMIPSKPVCLSSACQNPPASASPKPPVRGDLPPTAFRPLPEKGAPVITPGAMMSRFSGPRGSSPPSSSLSR